MKTLKPLAALLAVALPIASANAAEVVIDLNANIDPTLSVHQADDRPMPQSLDMEYNAITRELNAPVIHTRLRTNDVTQNVDVRLGSTPQLVHRLRADAPPIPVSVQYDGRPITTATTTLPAALVWTGPRDGESRTMPLAVSARPTGTTLPVAGRYVGRLEVLLAASAASTN